MQKKFQWITLGQPPQYTLNQTRAAWLERRELISSLVILHDEDNTFAFFLEGIFYCLQKVVFGTAAIYLDTVDDSLHHYSMFWMNYILPSYDQLPTFNAETRPLSLSLPLFTWIGCKTCHSPYGVIVYTHNHILFVQLLIHCLLKLSVCVIPITNIEIWFIVSDKIFSAQSIRKLTVDNSDPDTCEITAIDISHLSLSLNTSWEICYISFCI